MQILYFNLNLGRMKGATESLRHHLGVRKPPALLGLLPLAAAATLSCEKREQPAAHPLLLPLRQAGRLAFFS